MRVTQIDYSAIKNANASRFDIKQTSLHNKQFRSDLKHQENMAKYSQQLRDIQGVGQALTSIGNFTIDIMKMSETQKKKAEIEENKQHNMRVEAEAGEANAFLEGLNRDLNLAIGETAMNGGSANRDADGKVVLNQGLLDLKDSQLQQIEDYDALPEVKEAMLKSFNQMWDDAEYNLELGLQKRDMEIVGKSRELELNNAIMADALNGNTAEGDALIDSWTHLTPKEREYQKSIYPQLVEQQQAANQKVIDASVAEQNKAWDEAYRNAIIGSVEENGIAATIASIEADKELTPEQRTEFTEYAKGIESKTTSTLAIKEADAFNYYMDNAETPFPLAFRQDLQKRMDAKGYDAKRQEKILEAVETEWTARIQSSMAPSMALVPYMSEQELDDLATNIESGEASLLFAGMDKEKGAYLKIIKDEKSKYTEARTSFTKEMTEDFKKQKNATQAAFNAGRISAVEAVAGLRSYMSAKYPGVQSLEIETEILDFENKILTNATFPTPYKTQVDSFIKTLKQTGENFFNADGQTPDEVTASVVRVQAEATAQLLDFFATHSMEELKQNDKLLTDEMAKITNGYFGEIIGKLEKIQDDTSTVNGLYGEQMGSLMKQIHTLSDATGSVSIDRNGEVKWRNDSAQNVFEDLATFGQNVMQKKLGLTLMAMPQPLSEENPVPVFQATTGDKFMFDEQGNFVKVWEFTPSGDERKEKPRGRRQDVAMTGLAGTGFSGKPTYSIMLTTDDYFSKPAKSKVKDSKVKQGINDRLTSGSWNQIDWENI